MDGRRSRKLDHETCSCRRLKDLIHRVISRLTVTEAGRTSVLSSRWRKRWTYHSNLCFDGTCSELAGYGTDRFVAHVTTVLQHHSRLVVDRFELRSPLLGKEHAHHLDRWFDFAASTKARHVALDLSPLHYEHRIVASPNKYRLPANQLAAPAGIVSLLLVNVCLELPPVSDGSRLLGFKALKKLELKFVVDLGDLTPFLASCPALEWLSISSSLIGHLVVPRQARCLRYLRLDCIGMHSIHLDATSLTTFEYVGTSSIPIKTNHGLKLSQASIFIPWFFDGVSYFWDELSCWLAPVDRLLLSLGMDAETRRFAKNPTEFIHLRHLTLFCHILRDPESPLVVLRLTQVLESAPQLEHLGLMNSSDPVPFLSKAPDCSIHPHVHHHLKTVQMTGVIGLSGQLELAKYILLSATAVEYMTLSLATPRYRRV
uniref:At1g61320/AtMIF1 LRR domain-containing protein n=1 Tax=Setaria italica TaxID=4555 RepID=K3YZH3_SETIT